MNGEPGTFSVVGICENGTRVVLCVNFREEAEALRMAKSLDRLGEYARIEVERHVVERAAPAPPVPAVRKATRSAKRH
jgi:hypothetical protein